MSDCFFLAGAHRFLDRCGFRYAMKYLKVSIKFASHGHCRAAGGGDRLHLISCP